MVPVLWKALQFTGCWKPFPLWLPLFLTSSLSFSLIKSFLHLPASSTHTSFLSSNHFFLCIRSSQDKVLALTGCKERFQGLWKRLWDPIPWDSPRGSDGMNLLILLGGEGSKLQKLIRTHQTFKCPLNILSPLIFRLEPYNLSDQWKKKQLRTVVFLHLFIKLLSDFGG